jgi:hypothetical protein
MRPDGESRLSATFNYSEMAEDYYTMIKISRLIYSIML